MSANGVWCVPRLSQLQHLSFQPLFFRQFYHQHKSLTRRGLSVFHHPPSLSTSSYTLLSFPSLSSNGSSCSAPTLPLSTFQRLHLSPSSPPLMSPNSLSLTRRPLLSFLTSPECTSVHIWVNLQALSCIYPDCFFFAMN